MRARLTKTSDYRYKDYKDFDTLEDLLKFIGTNLEYVINGLENEEADFELERYDDYRE